jgi:hypothetical protein
MATEPRNVSAMPGIGISIFIGAVGAVLRYAVTTATPGFNLHTGGVILMVVGAVGVFLSLVLWSSLSPFGRRSQTVSRRETTTTEDGHERGTVVRETRSGTTP